MPIGLGTRVQTHLHVALHDLRHVVPPSDRVRHRVDNPLGPAGRGVVTRYRGELAALLADDRVMGAVWGRRQAWNFPFGRGAKGGKFV